MGFGLFLAECGINRPRLADVYFHLCTCIQLPVLSKNSCMSINRALPNC